MGSRWRWLIGGGTVLAAATLFTKRKELSAMTGRVIQAGQEAIFGLVIPAEARPLAPIFLQVAREKSIDPFLLVALAMRESRAGRALRPDGTGDCTARTGWKTAGANGLPLDGLCWGRGIMQVDYGLHTAWVTSNDWRNPLVNIRKGADILKQKIAFLSSNQAVPGLTDGHQVTLSVKAATRPERNVAPGNYRDPRPLVGDLLERAAIAAYNTGEGNVLMSVAAGLHPDVTTAGEPYGTRNYSSNVISVATNLANAFAAKVGIS